MAADRGEIGGHPDTLRIQLRRSVAAALTEIREGDTLHGGLTDRFATANGRTQTLPNRQQVAAAIHSMPRWPVSVKTGSRGFAFRSQIG